MDYDEYEPIISTLNLSIELDNDINYEEDSENEENRIPWHRARNITFEIPLPLGTRISDLSRDAKEILVSHLSLPTLGTTMKNWESIAHSLGMSVDTIMALRQCPRPCEEMLDRNQREHMFRLIVAIEEARRLDTLYSLTDLAKKQNLLRTKPTKNEAYNDVAGGSSNTFDDSTAYSGAIDTRNYILVAHLENTVEEGKIYRHFKKNLVKFVTNFQVLDINDDGVIRDSNIKQSAKDAFQRAIHIVVVLNQPYVELCQGNNSSASNHIHFLNALNSLMNDEYYSNDCNNYRFRHVTFSALSPVRLPDGWPKSSNPYKFQETFTELVAKINKKPLNP